MTVRDEWWVRDATGQVLGPFPASTILATVQRGDAPASIEVSDDRVMWAGVTVHPGFRAATVAVGAPASAPAASLPPTPVGPLRHAVGLVVLAYILYRLFAPWVESRAAH